MIMLAWLLWSAAVPAELMARADDANSAFVGCLFAYSREASAAGVSASGFEDRLAQHCASEQRELQDISVRIFRLRGDSDALGRAQRLARAARSGVAEQYRKSIALGPAIEEVAKICRARPESCRD